jgi:hypothetical protein
MTPDEALSVALASDGQACNIFSAEELSAPGTLKKAFRRLALLLHPDKNSHPDAAQGFQKLQAAFEAALAGNHGTKSKPQPAQKPAPQSKPAPKPQPAPQRSAAQEAGRHQQAPPPPSHAGAPPPPKPPKPPAASAKADFFDDDFPLPPDVFDMPLPKRSGAAAKKKAGGGAPPPPPPPMPSGPRSSAAAGSHPPPPPPPPPRADVPADPPRRSQPYGGVPQHATENVSGADRAWEEAGFFSDRPPAASSTAYSWKPDPPPAETPTSADSAAPSPTAAGPSPRAPPPPPKRTVQLESLQSIFSRLDVGMEDDEDIDVALRRATGEKAQPTVSSSYSAPRPSSSASGARATSSGLGSSGGASVVKVYCRACGQSNNVPASGHGVAVCRGCHAQFSVAAAIADPGKPKKKSSTKSGGDRCACGAARKGQCFMCS